MKQKAFTLIELLVVVAIIGILAAVGVNTFTGFQEKAKTSVIKSRHASIQKDIAQRLMWCEISGERYFYFKNSYGSNDYLDCESNNWGKTASFASYHRAIHKNPYGALNGAWDGSTYFVDRHQIPTSCKANEVGYSFLTSFEDPNGYFKLGSCYKEGKAPFVDEVKSLM